ncbi:hypothetical protein BHQ18_02860 [Mycolicibacterium flavescens]|uniref:Transmembrane protein n=2 Tax=Mycolicibacterium flavescens TaxID=1776 RepID=A0A1E3RPN3_MYCFV|nr:hypothetical protein BHQ18_02860 [Mycolicibacterium flavescens]
MMLVIVAVLGLFAYGVGFADPGEAALWSVRFAAAAALMAVFGLLSSVGRLAVAVAVLAGLGFLDGLWSVLGGDDPGWVAVVLVALGALQTVAATAALLVGDAGDEQAAPAGYEAYVDYYNKAVRSYYDQHAQAGTEQMPRSGYGQGHGAAQASTDAQYAGYADYADLGRAAPTVSDSQSAGPAAARPSGLPSVGQAPASADRYRPESGQSAPPSSPA